MSSLTCGRRKLTLLGKGMVGKSFSYGKGITKKKPAVKAKVAKNPSGNVSKRMENCCKKVDKHYVDLATAAYNTDTTGTLTLIATIPTGATQTTRVGKKVVLDSLQIRGRFIYGATPGTSLPKALLLIVYDRRPTGVLPAITDVLAAVSSFAFNNDDNSNRFKIIRRIDRMLCASNVAGCTSDLLIEEFIRLNKYAEYKSLGTGAIADIEEGALYAITASDIAAGAAAGTLSVAYRTRFHED